MTKEDIKNKKLEKFLKETYAKHSKAVNGQKFYKKAELCRRFKGKKVKIYYVKLHFANKREFWKLGITSRTLEERMNEIKQVASEKCEIEVIAFAEMSGLGGLLMEKYLHLWFRDFRTKENILQSANSEVYVRDVLAFWIDWGKEEG